VTCGASEMIMGEPRTGELLRCAVPAPLEVRPNRPWFGARGFMCVASPENTRPRERLVGTAGLEHRTEDGYGQHGVPLTVMIMAGGTGGHVYPALAVARQLLEWGHEVIWVGTRKGLEARVVPAAGIPIAWLSVGGLRGKGTLTWLLAPLKLTVTIAQAFRIMLYYKPGVVLGMGGFAAGPGAIAAFVLGRPLVVHEQNALAGLTNRLLASLATKVLEGFPGAFRGRRACLVGNPIRREIAALPPPEQRMTGREGPLRLLVLGGSLGAKTLNEVVPETLRRIPAEHRPQVWHQAGRAQIDGAVMAYRLARVEARVEAFIEDMAAAYAWCDLVLCRAGALTIAELAAAGVGAILVPYPFAVDDHQGANAHFLSEADAALVVRNDQFDTARLAALLEHFRVNGRIDRAALLAMACAARRQAYAGACEQVARICLATASGDTRQGYRSSDERGSL
jgi:UDP-N-acetylglucosamine--N-acetylmuramyl-(pentapeptide) pyrophosphoryl-undecaprenol N-acetylglucosamine transferase